MFISSPHIQFDLTKLRQALIPFSSQFTDIYEANKGLHLNYDDNLVSSVKDYFFQVSLTKSSVPVPMDFSLKNYKNDDRGSHTQKYRKAISRRTDFPWLDEHNWNVPTKPFQDSYFYKCVQRFKNSAIRVRLTTINAGKIVTPHIDYDINYAVRIVVPIYTNKQCWNCFWLKGQKLKFHIPADGHPYFLNVGLKHSVENRGKKNRIAFMFSLAGVDDILHLSGKKAV